MRAKRHLLERILASLAMLMLAACSGEKPAAAPPGSAPKASSAPATAASGVDASTAAPPVLAHRSKFTVGPNLRDPFFTKKGPTGAAQVESSAPMDVTGLLRAGFQGTIGSGSDRLALINNVILEAGRTVVIPLNVPGQKREVTARVRQVLPNSVVLEVQGQPRPITITRTQR